MSIAQDIQKLFQGIFTGPIAAVAADAQARIDYLNGMVAAGKMTQDAVTLKLQCPTNVLAVIKAIQDYLGMEIPEGAGAIWLIGIVNDMSGDQAKQFGSQIKATLGTCQAMFHMPGLPF